MGQYIDFLQQLIHGNPLVLYFVVFLVGFITSLNPHMLGMVPIFIGSVLGEDGNKKWVSLVAFSLSFSLILTILGMVVALVGMSAHLIMVISYTFAGLIYIYMGVRLLGFRPSKLIPIKIVMMYSRKGSKKSRYLNNILMPLIFTPCSLPIIISVLTLALLRGNIVYGGTMLFSFGLGHSLIFILFGLFSGTILKLHNKLQKSYIIQKVIGVLLIIIGIVFLSLNQNPDMHNHH